jgi:hypothetical protein
MFERSAGNALGKGGRMVPGEGTHTHDRELGDGHGASARAGANTNADTNTTTNRSFSTQMMDVSWATRMGQTGGM